MTDLLDLLYNPSLSRGQFQQGPNPTEPISHIWILSGS